MTTVIVDTQELVIWADKQTTNTSTITDFEYFTEGEKISSIETFNGEHLLSSCGDYYGHCFVVDYLSSNGALPHESNEKYNNQFILVHPVKYGVVDLIIPTYKKKKWWNIFNKKYKIEWDIRQIRDRYRTIGSGADYAEAFLSMGFNPENAIKETSKLDRYTNSIVECRQLIIEEAENECT